MWYANGMRKILIAISLALSFVAACVDPPADNTQTAQDTQALAGSITVPVPTDGPQRYVTGIPVPPPWGFYSGSDSDNDFYIPIYVVPVGATITHIKARILGTDNSKCNLSLWRMRDFYALDSTPLMATTAARPASAVTAEADVNVPSISLQKLYLSLHSDTFNGVLYSPCYVMAAEVTYTPAP